ncbi:MAG: hypothetical protein H6670_01890 [Anaerolineaceae bacterium]|nr:hypothetical protein [Anaerolineaceae bacterium]
MIEPVEKVKRKGKPRTDRYSQNEATVLIMGSISVSALLSWFFEWLNPVAGMFIPPLIIGLELLILPFLIYFLRKRWSLVSWETKVVFIIIELILAVCVILKIPFVVIPIFLTAAVTYSLTSMLIPLLIFLAIIACVVAGSRLMPSKIKPEYVRHLAIAILVTTVLRSSAVSWWAPYTYSQHDFIPINGSSYYLLIRLDVWDSYKHPIVYECHQFIFDCDETYLGYWRYWDTEWGEELRLVRGDHDNVLVLVDGQVVFDSSEDVEQ